MVELALSTMMFSVLSGVMYLRLNRQCLYSYLFIAIGYLLYPPFIEELNRVKNQCLGER